jgi:hypothetical protein
MRDTIAKLVQSAIKTVGDIAEPITYNAKTEGSYDTNTGEISENTTVYPLNAVISAIKAPSNFPSEVVDGIADFTVLFASLDLPIEPNTGDTITRMGENYKIIKPIIKDPAGASTELLVKRIG